MICEGHLEILAKGTVEGDIAAKSMRIETGGVFRGTSRMGGARRRREHPGRDPGLGQSELRRVAAPWRGGPATRPSISTGSSGRRTSPPRRRRAGAIMVASDPEPARAHVHAAAPAADAAVAARARARRPRPSCSRSGRGSCPDRWARSSTAFARWCRPLTASRSRPGGERRARRRGNDLLLDRRRGPGGEDVRRAHRLSSCSSP